MRNLLALLFLLFAVPASAAIATNGSVAYDDCGGSACTSFSTGNVNTIHASAVMAVAIETLSANDTTATVTDGDKSSWSRAATIGNTDYIRVEIWKCADLLAANVAITVALSNSRNASAVTQFYTGVAAFGATALNTGSDTAPTVSLVTQDANNYAVAGCANNVDTYSANVGNLRGSAGSSGGYGVLSDNTNASPTTVTNTLTASSGDWACAALELRSTAGGGGGGGSKKFQVIVAD